MVKSETIKNNEGLIVAKLYVEKNGDLHRIVGYVKQVGNK